MLGQRWRQSRRHVLMWEELFHFLRIYKEKNRILVNCGESKLTVKYSCDVRGTQRRVRVRQRTNLCSTCQCRRTSIFALQTLVRRRLRTEGSREKVQNRKSTDSSASPKTSKKMKVPGKKYKTKNLSYQIVRLMEKDGFKSERCCTIFSTLTPVVSLKMF
ncbi:uncharacterized protein LOC110059524 isoform X2 [Orbicella faveolata]|uniref:uncharacterized protein LOC110059524 isoform X2 n=1 Tax=Orbicella faveolata TaxID=48498 RepID=UPI0009E4869B|nr:uncharacterized protein LOC110059524 isoform X2 [Orbicella faveolata]